MNLANFVTTSTRRAYSEAIPSEIPLKAVTNFDKTAEVVQKLFTQLCLPFEVVKLIAEYNISWIDIQKFIDAKTSVLEKVSTNSLVIFNWIEELDFALVITIDLEWRKARHCLHLTFLQRIKEDVALFYQDLMKHQHLFDKVVYLKDPTKTEAFNPNRHNHFTRTEFRTILSTVANTEVGVFADKQILIAYLNHYTAIALMPFVIHRINLLRFLSLFRIKQLNKRNPLILKRAPDRVVIEKAIQIAIEQRLIRQPVDPRVHPIAEAQQRILDERLLIEDINMVPVLIQAKANPKVKNAQNLTILHQAIIYYFREFLGRSIQRKAPNVFDVRLKVTDVDWLLDNGAKVDMSVLNLFCKEEAFFKEQYPRVFGKEKLSFADDICKVYIVRLRKTLLDRFEVINT